MLIKNSFGRQHPVAAFIRGAWFFYIATLGFLCFGRSAAFALTRFRETAAGVQADYVALDEAWHRVLGRLPPVGAQLETIDLVLAGAVDTRDLNLRIYRANGRVVRVIAWAPEWNDAVHEVRADLNFTGQISSGAFSGVMHVVLNFDGWQPLEGRAWHVWYNVSVSISSGNVEGTYRAFVPEDREEQPPSTGGKISGRATAVSGTPARPAGLPEMRSDRQNAYHAYSCSRAVLRKAEKLYQLVRAVAVAEQTGMPYADCVRQTLAQHAVYMSFDPPTEVLEKELETGPSLDAMFDSVDLGLPGTGAARSRTDNLESNPDTGKALKSLEKIRERTAKLLKLVKQHEARGRSGSFAAMPVIMSDDTMFHPWYETRTPLVHDKKRGYILPVDAGMAGVQNWAPLTEWRLLGPFPVCNWEEYVRRLNNPLDKVDLIWSALTPGLPALVVGAEDKFEAYSFRNARGNAMYRGPGIIEWNAVKAYNTFGGVTPRYIAVRNPYYGEQHVPPGHTSGGGGTHQVTGMDLAVYLAETEVTAVDDVELWAALGVYARGMLWLNDELIWAGPDEWRRSWTPIGQSSPPDHRAENATLVRLPFRKGVNRLRVRFEAGNAGQYFWLRLCTAGRPQDPQKAEAHRSAVAAAHRDLAPAVTGLGFQGDRSGIYNTQPPIAWNIKQRKNIAWYTALPFWSNSSPVPAGDRVFVMTEYDRLYALSRDDGRILWEAACNAIDTLPEDARNEGQALYDKWWTTLQQRNAIPAHLLKPDRWRERSHLYYWEERDADSAVVNVPLTPELEALRLRHEELAADPDPESVQEELTRVIEQIDKLEEAAIAESPEGQAAVAVREEHNNAYRDLIRFLTRHLGVRGLDGYWQDYDGYQFSTPVSDGKHVWVKSGWGGLACFDMDGNRKYVVAHGGQGGGSRTISSPLLVDGRIIMHLNRRKGESRATEWQMVAFDAETGRELWSTPCRATDGGWSTPNALRLTDGRESMAVVVSSRGSIIRMDDGVMLVETIGATCGTTGVAGHGDTLFFSSPPLSAFRLTMQDRDTIGFRPLWRRGGTKVSYGMGAVADGIIYLYGGGGMRNGAAEIWCGLRRLNKENGGELAWLPLFRKGGNSWSMPGVSRDYVYFYSGDNLFNSAGNKQPMTLAVVERGEEGDLLALNAVERSYSAPVMDNNRLYMRGYQGVWCVDYSGVDGRVYEARHVAETLLDQIAARRPKASAPLDGGPAGFGAPSRGRRNDIRTFMNDGMAPSIWYLAGPLSAGGARALQKEYLEKERWSEDANQAAGSGWELTRLNKKNFPGVNAHNWIVCNDSYTLIDRQRQRVVDFLRVVTPEAGETYYLYAEYRNDADRTVLFELGIPGAKAWVNNIQRSEGDRINIKEGTVVLLIELNFDKAPDLDTAFEIAPRFWYSDDPAAAEKEWLRFVTRHRSRFEQAVKLAPASIEGRRSAAVLSQID